MSDRAALAAPAPLAPAAAAAAARRALTPRWANLALLALGGLMLLLFWKGAHDQNTKRMTTFLAGAFGAAVPYALASWVALCSRPARSTLWLALGFALLFRVAPLFTDTYLSTDLYRYVWDGRVQAHGINPYRYVPGDLHLVPLRDGAIYENINRRNYAKTVYPPGSQMVFLLVTRLSESVTAIRVAMVVFEALAAWFIILLLAEYGLPAQRVLLYAWHPLVVWEFAGGGHCDAIMIACVALAFLLHRRGREMAAGAALGLAVLAKLFPLILFPALYRKFRGGWKMPLALAATVCAGYLPYTLTYSFAGALGFLPMYTQEEGLQSGDRFYFLNMLPLATLARLGLPANKVFMLLAAGAFAAAAAWAFWKRDADERSVLRRGACVAAMFVGVLSPAIDWYCTWLVFFLPFLPEAWLGWMTASAFVLYENWFHLDADDIYVLNSIIFLPTILLYAVPAALRWWRGVFGVLPVRFQMENPPCADRS